MTAASPFVTLVYGPDLPGKDEYVVQLAAYYHAARTLDAWDGTEPLEQGDLIVADAVPEQLADMLIVTNVILLPKLEGEEFARAPMFHSITLADALGETWAAHLRSFVTPARRAPVLRSHSDQSRTTSFARRDEPALAIMHGGMIRRMPAKQTVNTLKNIDGHECDSLRSSMLECQGLQQSPARNATGQTLRFRNLSDRPEEGDAAS